MLCNVCVRARVHNICILLYRSIMSRIAHLGKKKGSGLVCTTPTGPCSINRFENNWIFIFEERGKNLLFLDTVPGGIQVIVVPPPSSWPQPTWLLCDVIIVLQTFVSSFRKTDVRSAPQNNFKMRVNTENTQKEFLYEKLIKNPRIILKCIFSHFDFPDKSLASHMAQCSIYVGHFLPQTSWMEMFSAWPHSVFSSATIHHLTIIPTT